MPPAPLNGAPLSLFTTAASLFATHTALKGASLPLKVATVALRHLSGAVALCRVPHFARHGRRCECGACPWKSEGGTAGGDGWVAEGRAWRFGCRRCRFATRRFPGCGQPRRWTDHHTPSGPLGFGWGDRCVRVATARRMPTRALMWDARLRLGAVVRGKPDRGRLSTQNRHSLPCL